MPALSDLGPLLLTVGLLALSFQFDRDAPRFVRAFCAAVCVAMALRYVWWRFEWSMPVGQNWTQQAWAWLFFVFESLSILSGMSVLFFMSRAGSAQNPAPGASHLSDAPVDVFIATYNEPISVLERTIVGAMAIDHRDLRVWVLDDGARDWVRDLAAELGAMYASRVKGAHAKAGNVNNGLAKALAVGRPPKFLLLLDADFVPYRDILRRTLGRFLERDVGIVQTPQHFFNADPIQTNLFIAREWPDEQRFFFNTLLACKDAWDAAFCCGTSAVFRVEALVAAGGLAVETVTEDMLTSFKMREIGYRTVFLNERLSMGLAPEGLNAYLTQRGRWCLGAIQQLYTRWSFAGRAKVGLVNRFSAFDGALYWIANAPFKLMMISGPLVYWWTQTAVISSTIADLIRFLAPSAIGSMLFMGKYADKRNVPIMTDVTQLISSFVIVRTVVTALARPWGRPFKVTNKGVHSQRTVVQWRLMFPFAAMAGATVLGIVRNATSFSPLYGTDGYAVNVFWSLFNVAVLVLACAICVELPRRRMEERFECRERATLRLANGTQVPCEVTDISLGGARLSPMIGSLRADDSGLLTFADGVDAPFAMVRSVAGAAAVRFPDDPSTRRKLIAKLFTGRYDSDVREIKLTRVALALLQRLAS